MSAVDFERSHPDFRGSNDKRLGRDDGARQIVDTLDVGLYGRIAPESKVGSSRAQYRTNESIWKDLLHGAVGHGDTITLDGFQILEWLPACPGRYFTPEAALGRERADQFWDWTKGEYLPLGKFEMVLGGVGSVRLSPRFVRGGEVCFFSASGNGISHQGIPVVVPVETGQRIYRELKEHGSTSGQLIGTLWPLPLEQSPLKFDRGIPKYYMFAERIKSQNIPQSKPLVTVAITYNSTYEGSPTAVGEFKVSPSKNWSFASFDPSQRMQELQKTITWLQNYAVRHSRTFEEGQWKELPPELVSIVGDFDEAVRHFDNPVEFPLSSILAGQYDPRLLEFYGNAFHITIDRKVVVNMGDVFSNIGAGATIVNRSTVQNAFNKVRSQYGDDVAQALNRVEEEINKSGNKDAADTFNSFNEELQKPTPKKSVLQALWQGVLTAVPVIGQLTDVISRIKTLIGG